MTPYRRPFPEYGVARHEPLPMIGGPLSTLTIDCSCCQLKQRIKDRDGAEPTICDRCQQHQGQLPERRLRRAEEHEAMLRERLTACRSSEAAAQTRASRAEERVKAALASRGRLAQALHVTLEEARHDCPATRVARLPEVAAWAKQDQRIRFGEWSDVDED
jgi:hypothetical protein